jgi:predicted nucleic acid-binding protein
VGRVTASILDTSVLIAFDPDGTIDLPQAAAISVISVGELHAGVELARDERMRAARSRRLAAIRSAFVPLLVDERVAESYGAVLATARRVGRTAKATDLLIIATARATGRTLVTLDDRQARLAAAAGQPVHTP